MIYQLNENMLKKAVNSSIKQVLNESVNSDLLKSLENIMSYSSDAYTFAKKGNIAIWKKQIARMLQCVRYYLDKIDDNFPEISQSLNIED